MNVKLLTKLRRKAHEEFGMAFFYDVFGRKVYSVGYRSRIRTWYEGGLSYHDNEEDAMKRLEELRQASIWNYVCYRRSVKKVKSINDRVSKL